MADDTDYKKLLLEKVDELKVASQPIKEEVVKNAVKVAKKTKNLTTKKSKEAAVQYKHLKKSWAQKHRDIQKNMWTTHAEYLNSIPKGSIKKLQTGTKHAIAGSMAGALLLAQPTNPALITDIVQPTQQDAANHTQKLSPKTDLIGQLSQTLPNTVEPLTSTQNTEVAHILSDAFKLKVRSSLDNKQLNRTYGYIGAEQHLMRYPGDTMASHFDNQADADKYYSSGMAPGRGAWGYFANSKATMTEEDVMREKYYIAVQTFLAPGWKTDVKGHYQFYKYRKMLVVNAENGKAVVAVIGDAGPGKSTGKHLGGSPEVMKHLERVDGRAKGPVLYFFIDDPDNTVPLGPIDISD